MALAVHWLAALAADLPVLLSILLPRGFSCIKKQVFEGYCFHSHSPCFFKFFVLEKSLNFAGNLDLVMSGLASTALPKQTSHCERGGSSPMEPSPLGTRSGSASRTLLCAAPAGIETATGIPLKIIPWSALVAIASGRIQREGKMENRKEAAEGAASATAASCAILSLGQ